MDKDYDGVGCIMPVLAVIVISALVGFACYMEGTTAMEIEAVEKGHAEWVTIPNEYGGRPSVVWKWKGDSVDVEQGVEK